MSGHKCHYINCGMTKRQFPNLRLFRFPYDNERAKIWITNSGNSSLFSIDKKKLHNRFICQEHFSNKSFTNINSKNRLLNNAIPNKYQSKEHPSTSLNFSLNDESEYNKVTRKKIIKELNLEPCGVTIQRESNVVKDEFYNDKTSQFYKLEYVKEEVLDEVFEELKCESNDVIVQPMFVIKQGESINEENADVQLSNIVKEDINDEFKYRQTSDGKVLSISKNELEQFNSNNNNESSFSEIIIKKEIIEMKHDLFDLIDHPQPQIDQYTSTNIIKDYKLWPLSKIIKEELNHDSCEYDITVQPMKNKKRKPMKKNHDSSIFNHENLFTCETCSKEFPHKHSLRTHVKTHMKEKSYLYNVYTKQNSDLKIHLKTQLVKKSYLCDVCSKTFGYATTLAQHMRNHTGEIMFTCDVCSKGFSRKCSLKTHMIKHTGEKPYICNVCFKQFTRNDSLKVHKMRMHTDKKPYFCAVCSKSFSLRNSFEDHIKTHSNKKLYACTVCLKEFALKVGLKNHMIIHLDKRLYVCDVCSKTFIRNKYLKIHKKIHSSEKPFSCDVCLKKFIRSDHLRSHFKNMHTKP